MVDSLPENLGLEWQTGVWDRISKIYFEEIDPRFAPVVDCLISKGALRDGETVLDLGVGTGAVAEGASKQIGADGKIFGVDISPAMIGLAGGRLERAGVSNVSLREGRAEELPVEDQSIDIILSSLCLMYVIDRAAAAREIARVLRPGGRLVAAVWAGADECDIVRFQQTAGQFAGPPPVPGVGPGAMADLQPFLKQLEDAEVEASVEEATLGFDFPDFSSAWDALAGVTTAELPSEKREAAKRAVKEIMYPDGDRPRRFDNTTQFIVGQRRL